jgi:hypothetical protein
MEKFGGNEKIQRERKPHARQVKKMGEKKKKGKRSKLPVCPGQAKYESFLPIK